MLAPELSLAKAEVEAGHGLSDVFSIRVAAGAASCQRVLSHGGPSLRNMTEGIDDVIWRRCVLDRKIIIGPGMTVICVSENFPKPLQREEILRWSSPI